MSIKGAKIVGRIGDVNPIDYGGGVVFKSKSEEPWIEYTYGLEGADEPDISKTRIETWFERDRARVALYGPDSDEPIVEWIDGAVQEAVDDGFLDPKDWHESAYQYADETGLLEENWPVLIYRINVPVDVFAKFDWADAAEIADSIGLYAEDEYADRTLIGLGRSRKIMTRVSVIEDIAGYYGWHELDQYPLMLTIGEIERRWRL